MPSLSEIETLLFGPRVLDPILWGNSLSAFTHAAILFFVAFLTTIAASRFLRTRILALARKTKTRIDDVIVEFLADSSLYFGILLGVFVVQARLNLPPTIERSVEVGLLILTTVGIAWLASKVTTESLQAILTFAPALQKQREKAFPILRRAVHILIWATALIFLLSEVGVNVTSIIAGLGIGGVAVALAGQETLANFLGSVTVLSDRPFSIGDFIEIDGKQGTVVDIGMRSTRIRLVTGTTLTIPNKRVAESIIENRTPRVDIRVDFELHFVYETPVEKLREAQSIIRSAVMAVKGVHQGKEPWINFIDWGDYYLGYRVTYWLDPVEHWGDILAARHEVNMQLKKELEDAGLQFAYPTKVVYNHPVKKVE
jgi:MscS family membrane protein